MDFHKRLTTSHCFVFGFALNGQGAATALDGQDPGSAPLWIHLDYSEPDCADILLEAGLPDTAIDSLTRTDTRPRTLNMGSGRILILRAINMNPGDSPDDMVSLRIWWDSQRLITIRQRRILATQELKADYEQGKGPDNLEDLFFSLIERMADRVAGYVDSLEDAIEACEDKVETGAASELRRQVSEVRRHAASVKRFLAPQRDALDSFSRQSREFVNEQFSLYLHEQADRIMRYVEDLDLIREKALLLQEELMNRIAQEQNSRMYVLSIIAAIFLPISFVTGLFGMNVGGLPGVDSQAGFVAVSIGMAAISAGILLWFRHKRWL